MIPQTSKSHTSLQLTFLKNIATRLTMFGTVEGTCPENEPTIGDDAYRQIWTDGSIRGAASEPPSDAVTWFYITNGFRSEPGSPPAPTTSTSIRLVEPIGSGGGCWEIDRQADRAVVTVGDCDGLESHRFWVIELTGHSLHSYLMADDSLG